MQWNSVSDFFAMGGYAFYVWGSFGATAALVALEMWLISNQRKELMRRLRTELLSERISS